MLYVDNCKIDNLLKVISDIMICLASITHVTMTMSKQRLLCFNAVFISNA